MEVKSGFWDKMAANYPRYDDRSIMQDAAVIFERAAKFGVDFDGKELLDIGCGTGTLAINLAKKGASITAIDLSKQMLEILQHDARTLCLQDTIKTVCSSWDAFVPPKSYDIALASMTPAVSSIMQYEKFVHATHGYGIFVGWGAYKNNDIIDLLISAHNAQKDQNLAQAKRFSAYLQQRNITHDIEFFDSCWSNEYPYNEALSYALDHLKRVGVDAQKSLVSDILSQNLQNGSVTFTTTAQKGIVVFKP